jgi:hypothetical protein
MKNLQQNSTHNFNKHSFKMKQTKFSLPIVLNITNDCAICAAVFDENIIHASIHKNKLKKEQLLRKPYLSFCNKK